ncbi:MAG: hypothetical protein HN738_17945 [Gammaproteobacteria bacterium]|jgi:hypothetical protein|nr:hypothetical protein [Gammaproteobacteria bacterium]
MIDNAIAQPLGPGLAAGTIFVGGENRVDKPVDIVAGLTLGGLLRFDPGSFTTNS